MMHPKTRLAIIAGVVSVLVLVPIIAIALGVGLGVGLSDDGGSSSSPPQSYVLQNTSIIFGALTPAGRGSVRLSARDSNRFASPFRGLGLLAESSQLPAFWRITPASGMTNQSASHWTWPSGLVAEGINATTPAPSAAGYAARLNGTTYTFFVEAFTQDNRAFKSAFLTINIDKAAVNIGTYDSFNPPWLFLGRGVDPSSLAISTIYLSTGIDRTAVVTGMSSLRFPKTVTVRHADLTRPGGILNLAFANCSNILVTNITFMGDFSAVVNFSMPAIVAFNAGCNNMAVRFCNASFTNELAIYVKAFVQFGGCINCEASDINAFRLNSGVTDVQNQQNINITVTRFRIRQFYNNAIWIGNSVNMTISDCVTMAAMRYTGDHVDHVQVADGAAPQGLKVIRHQMYKAEGNAAAQGFFGGTPGIYQGYIDDGSGSGYTGNPGNVMTITGIITQKPIVPFTWMRGLNFTQLIQVNASAQSPILGKYTLFQKLASPPGIIHTAPFNDLTINGATYSGFNHNVITLRGVGGRASIKGFTTSFVNTKLSEAKWTYFTGTLNNATLTVTKFQSGPPMSTFVIQLADGTPLTGGNGRPLIQFGGTGTGALGTYLIEGNGFNYPTPTAFRGADDLPVKPSEGPSCDLLGVDISSLYPAQTTLSSLYVWSSLNKGPGARTYLTSGNGPRPSTVTVDAASTVWNSANSTFASLCFAQGDPELGPQGLELITAAQWEAMSFDEAIARHVQALTPRVGGPLTSGTTDFGAFTRDGLWNDGSGKRPYN